MFLGSKRCHEQGVMPLEVIRSAAILNIASVNSSGCCLSRASFSCRSIILFRSEVLRVASKKWSIPATYMGYTHTHTHIHFAATVRWARSHEQEQREFQEMNEIVHLSCIAIPQVQRGHEVGVIFLNTCWSLCELIGLEAEHIHSCDYYSAWAEQLSIIICNYDHHVRFSLYLSA